MSAPWWNSLLQDFYHVYMIPLLLVTVVLAWFARPALNEETTKAFVSFKYKYLIPWSVCVGADWLQGPYVYALYKAYGFSGKEIAQLFVAGFMSSLVFGCLVGTVTDHFGRKRCCLGYCVLYIISCLTKHAKLYSVLMFGRITGGIATSMLFSCFECWLVSEHLQRHRFSGGLLSYMFGMMFSVMYIVAIVCGIVAQWIADAYPLASISTGSYIYMGGYCGPFDLAIVFLLIGMVLIALLWEENYGDEGVTGSGGLIKNITNAVGLLFCNSSMMALGAMVASFEGAMYAFVFNWTPALDSKVTPPPHGLIFACFMMACMCGASASTIASRALPTTKLLACFSLGTLSFCLAAYVASNNQLLALCFTAFLVFEFCVGVYFPTVGVLKSEIVPEHIRGTMYNIYRVPLNAIVVGLLLSDISMVSCFKTCAGLMALAGASLVIIITNKKPYAQHAGDIDCDKQV